MLVEYAEVGLPRCIGALFDTYATISRVSQRLDSQFVSTDATNVTGNVEDGMHLPLLFQIRLLSAQGLID